MFEPIRTLKDLFDQVSHALLGAGLVFVFSVNIGLLYASLLTLAIAVFREIVYQHWMKCGEGCRTDIFGWLVGIVGMVGFLL